MNDIKQKWNSWLTRVGKTVATKLNAWINPISSRAKKGGLIVIGLLTLMLCLNYLISPFRSDDDSPVITVEPITTPPGMYPMEEFEDSERNIMAQYNRMIRMKELVEKLMSSNDEKGLDSLMQTNPGLRDSLNEFLKQYY